MKIICIDFGEILHASIYASRISKIYAPYTAVSMILGFLGKADINIEDLVFICCDGQKLWRKELDKSYKANRVEKKQKDDINWDYEYQEMNKILESLKVSTDWNIIKIPTIESDDLMAIICKTYNDKEIILVTSDSDLEQMWDYGERIKIISTKTKKYKIKPTNFNIYKLISKKIEKEKTDNLINPILNENDFETRKILVSLLDIPEFIETQILDELKKIEFNRDFDTEKFPFQKLKERYYNLYENKKPLTYKIKKG